MNNVNVYIGTGNLTKDPEKAQTPQGVSVCNMTIAVNERPPRRDGEAGAEKTTFVDVTVWGTQADNCAEHLKKGAPILVQGRLYVDEWVSKPTMEKRSKLRVKADQITFLGPKPQATI